MVLENDNQPTWWIPAESRMLRAWSVEAGSWSMKWRVGNEVGLKPVMRVSRTQSMDTATASWAFSQQHVVGQSFQDRDSHGGCEWKLMPVRQQKEKNSDGFWDGRGVLKPEICEAIWETYLPIRILTVSEECRVKKSTCWFQRFSQDLQLHRSPV